MPLSAPALHKESADQAQVLFFGWLGVFFSLDLPASSTVTRELLGWRPTRLGLLNDLEQGHYFDGRAA